MRASADAAGAPPPPDAASTAWGESTLHWAAERAVVSSLLFCGVWLLRRCWRNLRHSQRAALGDPAMRRARSMASAWRASRAECQALLLPVGGSAARDDGSRGALNTARW